MIFVFVTAAIAADEAAASGAASKAPIEDVDEDLADAMFRDLEGHDPPLSPSPSPGSGSVAGVGAGGAVQRVGLVLDHHYLEVAAKQSALATTWDPTTLITAIQSQLSTALAAESPSRVRPVLDIVECHAADSLLTGGAEYSAKGKLHQRLTEAGFTMHCSPNKSAAKRCAGHDSAVRSGGQGATDVDVVVCLFDLAGAFGRGDIDQSAMDIDQSAIDHIILVGPDSDYRPALEYLLRRGPPQLRIWVVADSRAPSKDGGTGSGGAMQQRYRQWLLDEPRAGILSLPNVIDALAKKSGKQVRVGCCLVYIFRRLIDLSLIAGTHDGPSAAGGC